MSVFTVYLGLGFEHLPDLRGYDHILFLAGLCAAYSLRRWRELLVLVTAFPIGHSVSLAVASLRLVEVNTPLVTISVNDRVSPKPVKPMWLINPSAFRSSKAATTPCAPSTSSTEIDVGRSPRFCVIEL